jgi:hypothetical protein
MGKAFNDTTIGMLFATIFPSLRVQLSLLRRARVIVLDIFILATVSQVSLRVLKPALPIHRARPRRTLDNSDNPVLKLHTLTVDDGLMETLTVTTIRTGR